MVEQDGWYHVYTRGSHHQFRHPVKPGKVTIAGRPSRALPMWEWKSIMRQAGLES